MKKTYPILCIGLAGLLSACSTPSAPAAEQKESAPICVTNPQEEACNRVALEGVLEALPLCRKIEIFKFTPNNEIQRHTCHATELQELIALLSKLKPLPFRGAINATPGVWYSLTLYDKHGFRLDELNDWNITDSQNATHPNHCIQNTTMYLPTADYARLMQLLQEATD